MIKRNKKGTLIVISGPTSAGKGTICKELLQRHPEIYFSVSMTTREKRAGEVEGKDYFFISEKEFENKIKEGNFLEYAFIHNIQYSGTPKDKVLEKLDKGIDVILEIDIQGALAIKEVMPEAIYIFIMVPNFNVMVDRIVKRGTETKEKIIERIKTAYKEVNEITKYNYVVVNDELEDAVKKVESIITAEKCRVDRIEEVDLDNKEEFIHEMLMKEM